MAPGLSAGDARGAVSDGLGGERSGDFIREAAGEPFFLHMSFPDPHHPFTPPGRYYDMYDPAELELPETFWADHTRSMPHLRQWSRKRGEQPSKMMPFAATEEQFREALAKQYGAITFIDDVVGRIVAELEERGELENTVFVITSDHGDMFGDQGVMLKMAMHYEGPIRVPYVLSGPGCASARSDAFASTLDIGPTLLDLAGADPMPGVHGRSQVAVLTDAEASVRDEVYIEEDEMFDAIGAGVPLRMRTLVTDSGRISVYEGASSVSSSCTTLIPGRPTTGGRTRTPPPTRASSWCGWCRRRWRTATSAGSRVRWPDP